mmetsp:Transcript_30636/g.55970  ORF Transcript_30636/g.55970 Transcript_30636/m.55970 type:complete len:683 (-) Transcript_30636:62-2110(-)
MGQSCNVGTSQPPGGDAAGAAVPGGPTFTLTRGNLAAYPTGTELLVKEAAKHVLARQKGQEDLLRAPLHTGAFRVSVVNKKSDKDKGREKERCTLGWRSLYALGPMLGDGISAKVYEAEALTQTAPSDAKMDSGMSVWKRCAHGHSCFSERGRRVAIKRFHRAGSRAFHKELVAMQRVGVHPHVLRLLESYEGFDGEDVLVLEYCDGSTVYDLYAREFPNGGLAERLITKIVRQLLLALEHIAACGVEHQDVKPENMMLYDVSVQNAHAELKLGDFGWATVTPQGKDAYSMVQNGALTTGAGSLWYAPPELNPPVKGIPVDSTPPKDGTGKPIRGRSDIWSVGVVAYLLLVGHNPFNQALEKKEPQEIDDEVLRLAAKGLFNMRSEKWLHLSVDARDFISSLLKVEMRTRPSATEAAHHPFLQKRPWAKGMTTSVFFRGAVPEPDEREAVWERLDGFQQLAWLAVVRAVSEPEIDRQATQASMEAMRRFVDNKTAFDESGKTRYLVQLAKELASAPVAQWLPQRPVWSEVVRLAFSYLDIDGDEILSMKDLTPHIVVLPSNHPGIANGAAILSLQDAQFMAAKWVGKWQGRRIPQGAELPRQGVDIDGFRAALMAGQPSEAMFDPSEVGQQQEMPDGTALPQAAQAAPGNFRGVMPGSFEQEEEEISWATLRSRAGNSQQTL